jgi:hypothetical protein
MIVKKDKDTFISQSPSGFNQEFTSGFMNEFNNKWDNLFLYKNGFMDLFASNKSIVDYLKDPKDKINSNIKDKNSFVKEFVNTFQNVKKFNVSGYVTFFDKDTEGNFKFYLSKTSTYSNLKKHQTFIPSNNLLMKIDPAIAANVNFVNIDQTFLGKDFNTIDFSKTIFHTKNYIENIRNLVDETSSTTKKTPGGLKNYNNKDFKNTLSSLERGLTQTGSSVKAETVVSTSDISQSKEAKEIDKNTAAFLIILSAATIPLSGLTLATAAPIATTLPSFSNKEKYKISNESIKSTIEYIKNSNFKDFSSTVGFSVKSLTVKDLREINNQYIKIKTTVGKKIKNLTDMALYNMSNSENKQKYYFGTKTEITYDIPDDLSNEVFTISYFSPFNFSGNDTELKKIYKTDTKIEVKQNSGSGSKNHKIKKIGADIHTSAYSVTVMNNDVLKKNLKNYKHRLGQYKGSDVDDQGNEIIITPDFINKVENINKSLNKSSSDLGSLIKNIEYIEGFINIDIEYIKLNKTSGDDIENEIYQNSYLFDPVICLETVNQTSNVLHLTNKESYPITSFDSIDEKETGSTRNVGSYDFNFFNIIKNKSVGEQKITTSGKNVLAYACKKTYSIFIGDVFKACEIVDNLRLRSLSQLYGSKFFYTNDEGFKYRLVNLKSVSGHNKDTNESSGTIVYPEFQPNFNLKFNSLSTDILLELNSNERKKNSNFDLSDPKNVQNAKKSIGDINREREPKKDESLKGSKEEKVLKISKSDITLENNKETKSAEEITFQKSLVSGGVKYREAISKGRVTVDDVGLELDYFKLNNINEGNDAKGKINKTGSNNVVYNMDHNALIKRRGNIQPKLVSLLNEAFNITQKSYPSLSKVEIYSGGSLPITLWGKIVDIIVNIDNDDLKWSKGDYSNLADEINTQLGFRLDDGKLAYEQIKSLLRRNNDKLDSNHSFGFGCDIKLKRKLSDSKEKYICLWQPNDNEDFIILKYFIKACFDLGASSVGAGLNYMSYPDPVKYDLADGLVIGSDKIGKKIKRKGIKLNVQGAHKKYVLDENDLLIRKNGSPSNGIHVDIVTESIMYFNDITDDDMKKFSNYIKDAEKIRESFRLGLIYNKKAKDRFKSINNSNAVKNNYLSKAINNKTSNPSSRTVWGQSETAASSESWLKEIIGRSNVEKGFELSEITTDNASKRTIDLFRKKHDKVDEHGNVTDGSVVSIDILKK